MDWLVADSLSDSRQWFGSHLSAYSHYLSEFGGDVTAACLNLRGIPGTDNERMFLDEFDVALILDNYAQVAHGVRAAKKIAMVASVHPVMPWDVKDRDGKPAFAGVVSSIPWMAEASNAAGVPGFFQPLAFDTRVRVAGMGVERDLGCVFIGTAGPNHARRTQLLDELRDVVTVLPPVFGREYFETLARATAVLNVHSEWSRGAANNMRMFEATGMGAFLFSDGDGLKEFWPDDREGDQCVDDINGIGSYYYASESLRSRIERHVATGRSGYQLGGDAQRETLTRHTYQSRIPDLVRWARSLNGGA